MVDAMVEDSCSRKLLHESSLRKIPDVQRLCQKFKTKRVKLVDLYKIYCAVKEAAKVLKVSQKITRHFTELPLFNQSSSFRS